MAHSGNPISDSAKSVSYDAGDTNKPDFRELNLGSPISPLRPVPAASSSSSSSGSVSGRNESGRVRSASRRVNSGGAIKNHSGELSVNSSPTSSRGGSSASKPGHTRSYSGGVTSGQSPVNSGGSSATSPAANALPTGNICPSGKMLKPGMMTTRSSKSDVLSLGTGNYGHGSIMRSGSTTKPAVSASGTEPPVSIIQNSNSSRRSSMDPEELRKIGNEFYKKGNITEALSYYDRAVAISPENAAYRCNRGAALMSLNRLIEALKEYEEALKINSGYIRAHRRLGSLLISLGQVESARTHLYFPGYQPDPNELKKFQAVENHLNKCTNYRKVCDWNGVSRECDAAIVSGADYCPQLFACKAEALLKGHRLHDADVSMSYVANLEVSCNQEKFFGMHPEAYLLFVRAQVDMAFGRFENAVKSIEKSGQTDPRNVEIALLLQNVRSVCRARARGNDLFKSERYAEACAAYGEGLRYDPVNPVLYCNRAACWFKLGQMERSLDDCNQALLIHQNYTKALLRRASTYTKLDRWAESVRDYEVLRRQLPNDNEIAESLFHAQVALKKSRGEEVFNIKFGGEVELITSLEQFKSAVASTGVSVVLFKSSDMRRKKISTSLDTLCTRYPSIIFLKVDVEESSLIAKAENVSMVPTIKIYKKGNRAKEMVCPSQEALESSVKHYSS